MSARSGLGFAMGICLWAVLMEYGLAASAPKTGAASKYTDQRIRIGVLTDMSAAYKDIAGNGSVIAAKMAIDDVGGVVNGVPVEMVFADHENNPAVAQRLAREWMVADRVDLVVDIPNSNAAVEVIKLAAEHNRVAIVSAAGSDRLTNENCSRNSIHWTYDTTAVTKATARAVMKEGGASWFIVTADYLFGQSLEDATARVVTAEGGAILGVARHPFPNNSYRTLKAQMAAILRGKNSGAQVIALASTGTDAINAIKQSSRFGIIPRQKLAALSLFITDVHAIGLYDAQGLYLTTGFYWDLNDATRKWSRRFYERHRAMPSMAQAGVYSAVTHYLKAVRAAGTDEAQAVIRTMKALPVNDFFAPNGVVRADGRMVHDMYLARVKTPAQSRYPWDYYEIRETIPGERAFSPLSESRCPLVSVRDWP